MARMTPAAPASQPLAAIDMGSNSFRLEIATLNHGHYRRVDYLKETVRLGAGLDAEGLLTEAAVERGLACLRRFAARLQGLPGDHVRAVATQTLREARNRNDFLLRAQAALGVPIEVISGREEARLIYAGVAQLQPGDAPRLVVDIGGRSTELILGEGRLARAAESFAVGSVGLSLRYFADGRLTAEAFRAAQVAAGAEFEEALHAFRPQLWTQALGSSGTAGAVSQVLQASGRTDGRITPAALRELIGQCIAAGHADRLDLPGLQADRRPVIAGGLAILYTLLVQFGIDELLPAKGALRQGVIVDLHHRLVAARRTRHEDLRDASVVELQRRFEVDAEQASRVRRVAVTLYQQLRPDAPLEQRRELAWACALHELGLMVSHHDHHRHSAYLLSHVDAAGFSQSQQRRLGELVLGQRGGLRKLAEALARTEFAWQLMALRLAVILCHARHDVPPRAVSLRPEGSTARLAWTPGWAAGHERTRHLLAEEAEAWQRHGPLRLHLPE